MKSLVYICSPYHGDIKGNTEKVRKYSRYAVDQGYIPIAPHLLFPQFMDEKTEREEATAMGLELLKRCDELWVLARNGTITDGMSQEIKMAQEARMKTLYFNTEAVEIAGSIPFDRKYIGHCVRKEAQNA